MFADLKRSLRGTPQVSRERFAFLLQPDTSGELVCVHCAATTYDVTKAELRTLAAVKVCGNRVLTSQKLVLTVAPQESPDAAVERFLDFAGARPLVGYYLDFTAGVLDRYVRRLAGFPLSNPQIEVSSLYYDRKVKTAYRGVVDLRLDAVLQDLDLPQRPASTPYNDALAAALIYLKLVSG